MSTIADRFFEEITADTAISEAESKYTSLIKQSDVVASQVLATLLGETPENKTDDFEFTLDEMTLGLARATMYLTRLYFDNEHQHHEVEQEVRGRLSERVAESIVAPQPCLICEACEAGEECTNLQTPSIPFAVIPMLTSVLTEEAFWKAYLDKEVNLERH